MVDLDEVHGYCDVRFQNLKDVFLENFNEHGEVGASVSVILKGKTMVDLWGGHKDKARSIPWTKDTITSVQSVVKGIIAICALQLVDRGVLELSKPVAHYWPEFGQAGKATITVSQLLSHMAGLVYPDMAPDGAFLKWDQMVKGLELQGPEWEPGTVGAYHSSTYGFLVGELVNKVSGLRIDDYFETEIGKPLDVDFKFTVEEERRNQVAELFKGNGPTIFDAIGEDTKFGRAWRVFPPLADFWSNEALRVLTPHAFSNGRALARIFGALGNSGMLEGFRLMQKDTIEVARKEVWSDTCALCDFPVRMCMGMFMGSTGFIYLGPNENSFGALGAGGATSFADPDLSLGFGYVMNQMCDGLTNGPKAARLIDAVYGCV